MNKLTKYTLLVVALFLLLGIAGQCVSGFKNRVG